MVQLQMNDVLKLRMRAVLVICMYDLGMVDLLQMERLEQRLGQKF